MANTKAKKTEVVKEEKIDVETIKKELKDYVTIEIKNNFNNEIEKANKRLLREKNKKIITRDIIIIILLAVIGYLVYLLYSNNFFDKYVKNNNNTNNNTNSSEVINNNEENTKKEEVHEPTLEELTSKYGYLVNNIYVNEKSEYLDDYFNANLTTELKNYITLNSINSDDIASEEEISVITDEVFKKAYEKIFNDDYEHKSFIYNGNEIKFVTFMKSYISDKVIDSNSTKVDRMITDVEVKDDTVVISTVEAIMVDGTNKITNLKFTFKNDRLIKLEK